MAKRNEMNSERVEPTLYFICLSYKVIQKGVQHK